MENKLHKSLSLEIFTSFSGILFYGEGEGEGGGWEKNLKIFTNNLKHHHFSFWKHGPTTKLLKQSDSSKAKGSQNKKKGKKKKKIKTPGKEADGHSTSTRSIRKRIIAILKLIFTNEYPHQNFSSGN